MGDLPLEDLLAFQECLSTWSELPAAQASTFWNVLAASSLTFRTIVVSLFALIKAKSSALAVQAALAYAGLLKIPGNNSIFHPIVMRESMNLIKFWLQANNLSLSNQDDPFADCMADGEGAWIKQANTVVLIGQFLDCWRTLLEGSTVCLSKYPEALSHTVTELPPYHLPSSLPFLPGWQFSLEYCLTSSNAAVCGTHLCICLRLVFLVLLCI